MAKQDNEDKKKKGGGKKAGTGCLMGVLAIILIIVLLASFLFAIFEAIIKFITNVILGIVKGLLNFLADPIGCTIQALGAFSNDLSENFNGTFNGWALEKTQPKQLVEISQKAFEEMRDSIDESISRDAVGLDDMLMKKMLLTYNTGKYSRNADIIIELTEEEVESFRALIEAGSPFKIKKGKDLEQINMNMFDKAADSVESFFDSLFKNGKLFDSEVYKEERDERLDKQENYYLHAKGVLKFINQKNQELVYYNKDVLEELFIDEFQANRYGASSDYAISVWNYLSSKCYTDGTKGMSMYSHEIVEEKLVEWTFKDNDHKISDDLLSNVAINRQIIDDEYLYTAQEWLEDSKQWGIDNEMLKGLLKNKDGEYLGMDGLLDTAKKEFLLQDIDYYSLVSQYSTPVEFMIDLLNISSSKEFVNAFMDKVASQTGITLKIYTVSESYSQEVTEVTSERTNLTAEAKVEVIDITAEIDGTLESDFWSTAEEAYEKAGIEFDCVWKDDNERITIRAKNIPAKYERIYVYLRFNEDGSTRGSYSLPEGQIFDSDPLGSSVSRTVNPGFFGERYKYRSNEAIITRYTTELTTETKLDIAVEKATTWYGNIKYENDIQMDKKFVTKDENGAELEIKTAKPKMISQHKDDIIISRDDSNKNTIFKEKEISDYSWDEIGSRIEKWYTGLDADDIVFWLTPGGHLTHQLVTLYSDNGYQRGNEDELLNIRLTYAYENGWGDAWLHKNYAPVEIRLKAVPSQEYSYLRDTGYAKGYLYETVNRYLVEGVPQATDNTDFFLSLLKNNTGEYKKEAAYNPNGKEVIYKTVTGSDVAPGDRLVKNIEMLINLIESSPNTTNLADIMRYIVYKYDNTKNYDVTEFSYDIINREGFEYI